MSIPVEVVGVSAVALGALAVCAAPVFLVFLVLRHRREAAAQRYKAALDLAERGVQVPADLLLSDPSAGKRLHGDLRTGVVLAASGLGIIAFALTLPSHPFWGIGLIPLFAGLGYLATWYLSKAERTPGGDA